MSCVPICFGTSVTSLIYNAEKRYLHDLVTYIVSKCGCHLWTVRWTSCNTSRFYKWAIFMRLPRSYITHSNGKFSIYHLRGTLIQQCLQRNSWELLTWSTYVCTGSWRIKDMPSNVPLLSRKFKHPFCGLKDLSSIPTAATQISYLQFPSQTLKKNAFFSCPSGMKSP
jgi:hypothetical protein